MGDMMFDYISSKKKKEPLYVSLYKHVKTLIIEDKYIEGQKLPSKRKLAQDLKLSPLTVEAAYQQLIAEGYVYSIEKKGYFVDKKVELIETNKREILQEQRRSIKEEPTYQYAFKTNVVDTSLFPNMTWAKLSRTVLSENHHEMLNMIHPQGLNLLRREISRYLELYRGIKADEDQIVIGSGSSSLINILIELLGRDKHYAIENPGYKKNYQIYQGNNVKLSLVSLDDLGIIIDELKHTNAQVVHITPSHQFPMGIVMPIQRRYELLNWANRSIGRYIIEDDYDSEFRFQGKPIPALQGFDHSDKVIYMNTFTKTLAPSFRMNYMVLPKKLLSQYQKMMTYHGCTVPNFEQFVMYKFMHEGFFERHINRMQKAYREKIEIIIKTIELYPNIKIKGYDTGLHFLMEIDSVIAEEMIVNHIMKNNIYVTGLKSYNLKNSEIKDKPTLVLGYSGLEIGEIKQAMKSLLKTLNSCEK